MKMKSGWKRRIGILSIISKREKKKLSNGRGSYSKKGIVLDNAEDVIHEFTCRGKESGKEYPIK